MPALSTGLLRAGIALKLSQIKRATRSYLRDRTNQVSSTVASYAIAAGLFAATGIFVLATCMVGITALFRWVEIYYGLFPAFGVVGALLMMLAAICGAMATSKLKQQPPHYPSLSSRMRVAIKARTVEPDRIDAVRDVAAAVLRAPSGPAAGARQRLRQTAFRPAQDKRNLQAGLAVAAILLGWAVMRRRHQA